MLARLRSITAMITTVSRELDRLSSAAWDGVVRSAEGNDGHQGPQLRRLITAAQARPELKRLFPYTSMGTLCFSHCSDWPFTTGCPCIGVDRELHFVVLADSIVRLAEEADPLLVTSDLDLAVQTLIDHLPADPSIWQGSRDDR